MILAQAADWLPIAVLFVYLAVVLYIGIFAFRIGKNTGEDFFMASRSIGTIVFFLSLFATNMTAFAIVGSSGMSYKQGIGVFGMMATSSAFVIPLTLFVIGTRLWGLGRRFGHMTQVQFFRDRWDCSFIGTLIFLLSAAMMIPYLIISIAGGGQILEGLTQGRIPYAVGGLIVALVVMGNVFFGGMRGAVLVNVFQTILFLAFGLIAVLAIGNDISQKSGQGFGQTIDVMSHNSSMAFAMTRERIPKLTFLSFLLIPLSSIMFPHMSIMCMTARKVTAFKKTVILYPLSIMIIWLPCCFLGAFAVGQPRISAMMAATSEPMKEWLEHPSEKPPKLIVDIGKTPAGAALVADAHAREMSPKEFGERLPEIVRPLQKANPGLYKAAVMDVRGLANSNSDQVLLHMLRFHVPFWLSGLLAAGIISAVMGSDCHQILALSTMFTKDIFDYYGGRKKYGEKGTVFVGRTFIVAANLIAYLIALSKPPIFELAISYAFSGFASLAPVMLAALFWKRSNKWGALAATIWVAASVAAIGVLEHVFAPAHPSMPPQSTLIWALGGKWIVYLNAGGKLMIWGWTPVVPMVLGSALFMWIFSILTPPPSQATIDRYFSRNPVEEGTSFAATPAGAH